MKRYLYASLFVIVALIASCIGFRGYMSHKGSFEKAFDYKPKGNEVAVVATHGREVTVVNTKGESKTVEVPRQGELIIGIEPDGSYSVKKPSLIQMSYHLALELDSKTVHPTLGVQVLRWQKLGISTNLSFVGASISLERDLYDLYPQLQNSYVGAYYRLNFDQSTSWGLCFGVYL